MRKRNMICERFKLKIKSSLTFDNLLRAKLKLQWASADTLMYLYVCALALLIINAFFIVRVHLIAKIIHPYSKRP